MDRPGMKTSRFLFLLMALTVFAANAVAQNPYTKSFSQAGVVPNRTGWSFWYMPTGVADTLNVKVSYVDTGMASHTPHAHNHDATLSKNAFPAKMLAEYAQAIPRGSRRHPPAQAGFRHRR